VRLLATMDGTGNFGQEDCKVFVGNLPKTVSKEEVMQFFQQFTNDGVVQIYSAPERGWATVELSSKVSGRQWCRFVANVFDFLAESEG